MPKASECAGTKLSLYPVASTPTRRLQVQGILFCANPPIPHELQIDITGRDSRGEQSPWLALETRPDSPGEPGMQPRDPCLPWRGTLGPGHTLR